MDIFGIINYIIELLIKYFWISMILVTCAGIEIKRKLMEKELISIKIYRKIASKIKSLKKVG